MPAKTCPFRVVGAFPPEERACLRAFRAVRWIARYLRKGVRACPRDDGVLSARADLGDGSRAMFELPRKRGGQRSGTDHHVGCRRRLVRLSAVTGSSEPLEQASSALGGNRTGGTTSRAPAVRFQRSARRACRWFPHDLRLESSFGG